MTKREKNEKLELSLLRYACFCPPKVVLLPKNTKSPYDSKKVTSLISVVLAEEDEKDSVCICNYGGGSMVNDSKVHCLFELGDKSYVVPSLIYNAHKII